MSAKDCSDNSDRWLMRLYHQYLTDMAICSRPQTNSRRAEASARRGQMRVMAGTWQRALQDGASARLRGEPEDVGIDLGARLHLRGRAHHHGLQLRHVAGERVRLEVPHRLRWGHGGVGGQ